MNPIYVLPWRATRPMETRPALLVGANEAVQPKKELPRWATSRLKSKHDMPVGAKEKTCKSR